MNYTIQPFDINTIGLNGDCAVIRIKVKGFWSGDTITLYVRRDYHYRRADGLDGEWSVQITQSSGGRDTKEVASDSEAIRYYGQAMVAAADLADEIMSKADIMEANYQAYRAKLKEEYEAEKAAINAKIEQDAPLGEEKAVEYINQLVGGGASVINVFARGNDRPVPLSCTIRAKTKLYYGPSVIAKKEALLLLAKSSNRTAFAI